MTLEIFHEERNTQFTGLLLAFELPDAAMTYRLFFLLAIFADQEKGLAIISPMLLDVCFIVENPLDWLGIIANVGDTTGFSSAVSFFVLLSTVHLAHIFLVFCNASCPLLIIIFLSALPHALCLVVDEASIFSFTIGAVRMVSSILAVFFEGATDVLGKNFWFCLDWARLRHTLRVRFAFMYLSVVIYRNKQVRSGTTM